MMVTNASIGEDLYNEYTSPVSPYDRCVEGCKTAVSQSNYPIN